MTTTVVGTIPTSVPGLLLRPVRWPEEAQLSANVNNASRLAGGSLFALPVDILRADCAHLANSDLAADLRLAEADGRPVGYVRTEWADENRGDRVHAAALFVTPQAPAGAFAAPLDWILARHLEIAAGQGPIALYQRMGFVDVARETEWRRPLLPGGSPAIPGAGA